jgi:catechol 2,3-dioxygenase-like lactoylglutathione lyase family enzyme
MLRLGAVVMKVSDVDRAAAFWSAALGYERQPSNPTFLVPEAYTAPVDTFSILHLPEGPPDMNRARQEDKRALAWQEAAGHEVRDELGKPWQRPPSLEDEEFVELGRAAGPQDVGGLGEADVGAQITALGEEPGVVTHPLEALGLGVFEQRCHVRVGGGGRA